MLPLEAHLTTIRIIAHNDSANLNDYIKRHISDINAWNAFFKLSSLNHNGKLREAFKILPYNVVVESACQFAESVLPIYEAEKPGDNRPRLKIEAARRCIKNPSEENKKSANAANAANAAHAAYAAYAAYAAAYAYAAANAAANTAYYAAANAAYYAAAYAYAAAAAAAYAADAAAKKNNKNYNKEDFEAKQIEIVINVIREYYNAKP